MHNIVPLACFNLLCDYSGTRLMPRAAANEKEGSELGALGAGAPQTPAEGTASPLHSPAELKLSS